MDPSPDHRQPRHHGSLGCYRRPVARLTTVPADLPDVGVWMPIPEAEPPADVVGIRLLASIQYAGNGRKVFVSVARPTPAAAGQPMLLGERTVQLPNGTTAWTTTNMGGAAPNQVAWTDGDLIIAVAGDVSIDRLKGLATTVVVSRR